MISIIYVYYNSFDVIVDSIYSVYENEIKEEIEIIVVVNKCNKNKINRLNELFPDLIIIINKDKNTSFAYANNIGAKIAKGKYLLILNPDTILEHNVLDKMYKLMENNSRYGASTCKLTYKNGEIQKTVIRKSHNLQSMIMSIFFIDKIPIINWLAKPYFYNGNDYLKPQFPKVISGAFMFIRKAVFEKVDGFDENYLVYSEDNDLSLRINEISKIYYNPYVTTIHIGASSLGKKKLYERLKIYYGSFFYFIEKFYGINWQYFMKIVLKVNGVIFYPLSYLILNKRLRIFVQTRSKLFVKINLSKKRKYFN